jgi:hypothetical protein
MTVCFLCYSWVIANLVDKTLCYYSGNPERTLQLYGVTEQPKGTLNISGAVASVAASHECASASTPHCVLVRTPSRDMVLCARYASSTQSTVLLLLRSCTPPMPCRDEETRNNWIKFLGRVSASVEASSASRIRACLGKLACMGASCSLNSRIACATRAQIVCCRGLVLRRHRSLAS